MKRAKKVYSALLLLTPLPLLAQLPSNDFKGVSELFTGILTSLIPLLIGAGLIVFFWGLIKFIYDAGNTESHREGKVLIVWGIVIIFVMISIWGIITFLKRSFLQ